MPTLLEVMESRLGIQEIPGEKNNPVIVEWAAKVGHPEIKDDETSWCSICMSSAALEAGLTCPPSNINTMARSWLTWGTKVALDDIRPGDVAVWPRGNPKGPYGHVNCVESVTDDGHVICIGGNQSGLAGGDAVTRARPRDASEAVGFRRAVGATVKELRDAGSSEIKFGDNIQTLGIFGTIFGPIIAIIKDYFGAIDVPQFASLPESLTWGQQIGEGFNAIWKLAGNNVWLAGVIVSAVGMAYLGSNIKRNRVIAHKNGQPLASELAAYAPTAVA
jgi:uncharacterized protein (TIGR02594 family)